MVSQYNFYDCGSQLPRDGSSSSPEIKAANSLKRQFLGKAGQGQARQGKAMAPKSVLSPPGLYSIKRQGSPNFLWHSGYISFYIHTKCLHMIQAVSVCWGNRRCKAKSTEMSALLRATEC